MIEERYTLRELYKAGSQAKVWKALDKITGAHRIIKTGAGMKKEAVLARQLMHPFIGYPYDCGLDPELGEFAVYPEFTGMNSLEWVNHYGKENVKVFALQAAEFLSFLHNRGWLYNDFKPEHFLLCENKLKVLDLGLCSPIKSSGFSNTFSGTFPYISPERLNGRPFDQRSDIFAFGILLLHLLLSEEQFPFETSLAALQSLLYKVNLLKEPWKSLVSQMTALEPSQRIASASELKKKLLPEKQAPILSSPVQDTIAIPTGILKKNLLLMHSNSEPVLAAAYNEILISAWHDGQQVFYFDLKFAKPEECFEKLCVALTGTNPGHPGMLFKTLEQRKKNSIVYVVFRSPELLTPEQRGMLFFGISCLAELQWIKVVLLTSKPGFRGLSDSWTRYRLPATEDGISVSIESLQAGPRKILNALAVAGGSLPGSVLESLQEGKALLELHQQGFTSAKNGSVYLLLSSELILSRMRNSQKEAAALRLLQKREWLDSSILFHLATNAGNLELAGGAALNIAKGASSFDEAADWYWKAFSCDTSLSSGILFRLTKSKLSAGNLKDAWKLLNQMRSPFGASFRFADLELDYFHRKHKLEAALSAARRYAHAAELRKEKRWNEYFLARQAGFHILQNDFTPAKEILDQLRKDSDPQIRGLRHHFRGLLHFYQGNLADALKAFVKACKIPHRFRSSSAMNVGVVLGKMGKTEKAEKWLNRSIHLFSKAKDQDRLCHAFNNLGMIYMSSGQIAKARDVFVRSLHLSRACRNPHVHIVALNNIGVTYQMDGRIDKAVVIHSKVYKVAKNLNLPAHQALALTNGGLHLAFMGHFRRALRLLNRAVHLKSELKWKFSQATAYEYLGITNLLARRFKAAEKSLFIAKKLFREAGCQLDPARVDAYLALVFLEKKDYTRANKLLEMDSNLFPRDSFDEGIYHYAKAACLFATSAKADTLTAIHHAERIFRRIPSLFWLAKVQKLKSHFYRKCENYEKSVLSMQAAYHLFSRLRAHKELQDLPREGMDMQIYERFLDRLAERLPYKALQMVKEILAVEELDAMVTKILNTALELSGMDRAILILNEEPLRVFKSAALEESNVQDILEVSQSVLKSTSETGKTMICFDASVDPLLQDRPSIIDNRILSVVCLPLRGPNGKTVGSLYMDSCEGVETLAGTEQTLLEIFSSIIGLALSQSLLLERSITENRKLRDWLELRKESPELIGNSKAMAEVLQVVHRILNHNLPVLITGETGTGKELVARVLHYSGQRKKGPFVAVNCVAFNRELLESELFGHEKGSFTGAIAQKKGVFEQAQNGTLLLDEIGEMPLEMQAKMLRVLQGGEYRRIGGTETRSTNARILFATNRNLEEMVREGSFREDLFYRIKVLQINLPPLRNRAEDIPLLAMGFLRQAMYGSTKNFFGFTPEALDVLKRYSWPGNVRQLKSEVERVAALSDNEWIGVEDLDSLIKDSVQPAASLAAEMAGSLSEIEKHLIVSRLKKYKWNVASAAKSLGITRHGLYSKMKRYHISISQKD